jgi:hypothetical protein
MFHIHLSAVDFLTTAMYIIIFGFFWRIVSALMHKNSFGQAMAFVF